MGTDAADAAPTPAVRTCLPPPGTTGSPKTIGEVVALINALPMPVSVPCLLETLDRPLSVVASRGVVSLQPAVGSRSPRIFLMSPSLIMTVVPEGKGGTVVEFGEFVSPARTLKAEIAFPVEAPLAAAAPYDRVRMGSGTSCRLCHREEAALAVDGAEGFVSVALQPTFREQVTLDFLRAERQVCDAAVEPFRCAVLGALFDHGAVRDGEFPADVPTIFN